MTCNHKGVFAALLLAVAACTVADPLPEPAPPSVPDTLPVEKTVDITFSASRGEGDDTKVSFDEGTLLWTPGDKILVFDGEKTETVELTEDDIVNGGKTATFTTHTLSEDVDFYSAAFPAQAFDSFSELGNPTLSEVAFQNSTNAFWAVSKIVPSDEMSFFFRNAGAIIVIDPGDYCFQQLFSWSPYLLTPPSLPATVLKPGCYSKMFFNCTGLKSAPDLPAPTLVDGCYNGMFACSLSESKIKSLKVGFSSFGDGSCTSGWLEGAPLNGSFTAPEGFDDDYVADDSSFPSSWTGTYNTKPQTTVSCKEIIYEESRQESTAWEILRMDEDTWDVVDRSLYEFKTREPVRVQLSKDKKTWWITNYTPKKMSDFDIEVYFPQITDYVRIAHIDSIPGFTRMSFTPDYYGKLATVTGPSKRSAEVTVSGPSSSERFRVSSTDEFWLKLQTIEADWTGCFHNYNATRTNPSAWYEYITAYYAREWICMLLNYAYIMSTPEYDYVMSHFKEIMGGDLYTDAKVIWDEKMYQTEKARFKEPFTFFLSVVKSSYAGGLGGSAGWLGVAHWNFYGHYYSYSGWNMIGHESMHCWKYGHDSNMTYTHEGYGWVDMLWQLHIWLAKKGDLPFMDPDLTGFTSAENAAYRYGGIDSGYNFTKRDDFYNNTSYKLLNYFKAHNI